MELKRVAIFASGNGSTAKLLLNYFEKSEKIKVAFLLCNNPNAKVIEIAKSFGIEVVVASNEAVNNSDFLIDVCKKFNIDFVILAGYLRKIPIDFISRFPRNIINIHPALLPKFGGKGMYGMHVHEAVREENESETGISIHYVNEEFDKGELIAQHRCEVLPSDSVDEIQNKVKILEQIHFATEVEKAILR